MRYYCRKCKSEYNTPNFEVNWCFICKHSPTVTVPDYQTPEQYERRTGKKWNGAVWQRRKLAMKHNNRWEPWTAGDQKYTFVENTEFTNTLCANSPEPPPDDYVPEVEA